MKLERGVLEDVNALGAEDANERRRISLGVGFRTVGKALLRDREPDRGDLILLYLAVVDAAMAGDEEMLRCVPMIVERLRKYATEPALWTVQFLGLLEGMEASARLALLLLRDEEPNVE